MAALDKKSGRDVADIMDNLAKEQGCTILLVTYDQNFGKTTGFNYSLDCELRQLF